MLFYSITVLFCLQCFVMFCTVVFCLVLALNVYLHYRLVSFAHAGGSAMGRDSKLTLRLR
jgi:hypothetical protein